MNIVYMFQNHNFNTLCKLYSSESVWLVAVRALGKPKPPVAVNLACSHHNHKV